MMESSNVCWILVLIFHFTVSQTPGADCPVVRCARPECPEAEWIQQYFDDDEQCPACFTCGEDCPNLLCPAAIPPCDEEQQFKEILRVEGEKCFGCVQCKYVPTGECPALPPGTVGICVEECSSAASCPTGQLCCSNGCGHTCQGAVTSVGECPALPPGTVGTCVEACSSDASCPSGQLCCSNGCGHTCQNAVTPPGSLCPVFGCLDPGCDNPRATFFKLDDGTECEGCPKCRRRDICPKRKCKRLSCPKGKIKKRKYKMINGVRCKNCWKCVNEKKRRN